MSQSLCWLLAPKPQFRFVEPGENRADWVLRQTWTSKAGAVGFATTCSPTAALAVQSIDVCIRLMWQGVLNALMNEGCVGRVGAVLCKSRIEVLRRLALPRAAIRKAVQESCVWKVTKYTLLSKRVFRVVTSRMDLPSLRGQLLDARVLLHTVAFHLEHRRFTYLDHTASARRFEPLARARATARARARGTGTGVLRLAHCTIIGTVRSPLAMQARLMRRETLQIWGWKTQWVACACLVTQRHDFFLQFAQLLVRLHFVCVPVPSRDSRLLSRLLVIYPPLSLSLFPDIDRSHLGHRQL